MKSIICPGALENTVVDFNFKRPDELVEEVLTISNLAAGAVLPIPTLPSTNNPLRGGNVVAIPSPIVVPSLKDIFLIIFEFSLVVLT